MRNLRKLSYVACAVFFFTSCEETYNDKLFWPGEISQEYGSYIKPYTLDLTYSGEKLIGKTVSFKTEDSETGTLTLNNIIPGEKETPISRIQLYENEKKGYYTFSGTNITMGGATVKYEGIITPKNMQLSLNVTMAYANSIANTYTFPAYSHTTDGESIIRNSGASYVNITTKAGGESLQPVILQIQQMATNILDVIFPYVLKDITFEKNGIVTASYTTSPVDMNEIMEVANSGKTDAEFKSLINKRTYESSPKGLAYWNQTGNKAFVVQLNIPAIVSLIAQNNGKQIDYQLIAGISEALLKSDPARLKLTLSAINMILNNEIITYILQLDDDTFATLLTWMKDGIPMGINSTKEHTYIYFNKETLMPFISIIGSLLETNFIEVAALFDKMEIGIDLTAKK